MGRMSRQKGKRGEREAAAELAVVFACEARRGVQFQGGPDSPDVVLEGVNVHVEAKRVEAINIYKAMQQAVQDAGEKVPSVWVRKNNEESLFIVRTKDLRRLFDAVWSVNERAKE